VITRRSALLGALGVAAAAAVPVAGVVTAGEADADAADRVPDMLAHDRPDLGGGGTVDGTPFALTHLAVQATAATAVRFRTRGGWSDWREISGCGGGHDNRPGGARVIPALGASGYEIQVKDGTASVVELNAVDGPRRRLKAPARPLPPPAGAPKPSRLPRYVPRAAWGADEKYRYESDGVTLDSPPIFFPVQTLTVHHSGGGEQENDGLDAAAWMRAIYYMQAVEKDWGDFGYQLAIDADGTVYEGTYSDPDPVPVFGPDRSADGLPMMVKGSHVGLYNSGNIGICVIGHFMERQPTEAARDSLTTVLALLAGVCELNPAGTTSYVDGLNPESIATIDTLTSHGDWNRANPRAGATDCPGASFHPQLPSLRQDVRDRMQEFGFPTG
jgi:hypothetical protein